MADIAKILDVTLYVGLSPTGTEQFAAKKLLDDVGVKYNLLAFNDESQHADLFSSISTWFWGPNFEQREITQFPIVHWREVQADYDQYLYVACGLTELQNSTLLTNAALTA